MTVSKATAIEPDDAVVAADTAVTAQAPATSSKVAGRTRSVTSRARLTRYLIIAAVLVLWEAVVRMGLVSPFFLAAPTQIATAAVELAGDGEVRAALAETLWMVAVAFVVAAVAGILLGAWLGLSDWAHRALNPVVALVMSTPKMIFLPLMLVIFGIGFTSKVAYGILSAVFYVAINVTAGVRMVNEAWLRAIRSMGASRLDRLRLVILPASLPAVAVGLWYGMKHALLGVLIADLFVSVRGIGFYINRYTASFRVDRVFAVVVVLSALAITLGWVWKRVDDRLGRWRPKA